MPATATHRLACATVVLFACALAPAHAQLAPPVPTLTPGLYVSVIDGLINLSNQGGSQNFSAGQFGFVRSLSLPPVIVPAIPTMPFTPPPVFLHQTVALTSSGASEANPVVCDVR